MGLAVQIIVASVYIIAVECHFDILNPLGSIQTMLHGPEKQHRWQHNIFNPAFTNRQPNNIYDSSNFGYGHGFNNGPIQNGYGSDGTILTYDNYGPLNGYSSLEEHGIPENPDYHEFKENNVQPDEGTHSENVDVPSHDISGVNEKNNSEENKEHDSKKETDNESGVKDDASVLPDKKKLLEDVVVNNDPKSSGDNKYIINTPNTNHASSSNPVVSNGILVPFPNNAGVQSNGKQIIGTNAASNLPVININGALYYYMNPGNNQVTTQKPASIILLPTDGAKPLLNIGTGSVTVPTNPNDVILNGNGQTSQPLNDGKNTNGGVNIADIIISYIQQHPELLQTNKNTASDAKTNPINGAVSTSSNTSPVSPTQNSGIQSNIGISPEQVANTLISFMQQHPEIFGTNAVSSNVPSSVPNGNVDLDTRNNIPNAEQGGAKNPSTVPNNAIDISGAVSSNTNQPLQNTGSGNQGNSGVTNNDVQGIIAFISQHPGIFAANAVSSNASNSVPNGNVVLDNRNNIPNAGQGGINNPSTVPNNAIDVSGAVSSNANQPLQNANQGSNGVATTDIQGIIAFISQHPEIFAANAIVPNSASNPVQGTTNSNLPNGEPHAAIGSSNNVKIPVNSQGINSQVNNGIAENGASKECDLITFLTQHPELFATNKPSGGAINSNLNQHPETSSPVTTVSPLPSSNGNMPSYVVVQGTGHQTTDQPPNDSGNGLPLKTNSFNNDGNVKIDINAPISVLGLSNTKDLEGVKVNKKDADVKETPVEDGAMSATKDSEELLVASGSEIITSTPLPVADADAVLQETTTEKATEK